jgi:hypothetical protein
MLLTQLIGGDAPAPLRAVAGKAQSEDAGGRYQNVSEFAADLVRFRNQDPVEAYRESAAERAGTPVSPLRAADPAAPRIRRDALHPAGVPRDLVVQTGSVAVEPVCQEDR